MAGLRDTVWWWNEGVVDQQGELDTRILRTDQPAAASMGQSQFGTDTSQAWIYAPAAAGATSSTRHPDTNLPPTAVQGGGFAIIPIRGQVSTSYWHDTVNPPYPRARKINAGTWTYRWAIRNQTGGPDLNNVFGPGLNVFRRKGLAGGPYTYTLLWQTKTPNYQGIPTTAGGDITFEWTASHPRVEFLAPDETLYIEAWHHGKGNGALGGGAVTLRGREGQALFGSFLPNITIPSVGDLWSRANADVAPATDSLTEEYDATRIVVDTTALTENAVREASATRRPTDSAPAIDAIARKYQPERIVIDAASATEQIARHALNRRTATETVTALDALSVAFGGSRQIADTVPTTEQAARGFSGARGVEDTTTTSDDVVRQVMANRDPEETTTVTEQPSRSVSLSRDLSEAIPTTDSISRQVSASRPLTDAVAEGGGDIVVRRTTYVFDD